MPGEFDTNGVRESASASVGAEARSEWAGLGGVTAAVAGARPAAGDRR